jgi:hypothetical protein
MLSGGMLSIHKIMLSDNILSDNTMLSDNIFFSWNFIQSVGIQSKWAD